MPAPTLRDHLERSIDALSQKDFAKAQKEAERALDIDKRSYEAFACKGIAQSKLNLTMLAAESFRRAFLVAPTNPINGYNLALHLFGMKEYWPARTAITESLKDDPDFAVAKDLLEAIDTQNHDIEFSFIIPGLRVLDELSEGEEAHVLKFMRGMERQWTTIGWIFVGLSAVAAILVLIFSPIPAMSIAKTGTDPAPLKQGVGPMITIFFMALSGICSIMWVFIDGVDKRKKLVWMIPSIVCCSAGFQAFPHALYMFMRKN